jgi:hypothetical protein
VTAAAGKVRDSRGVLSTTVRRLSIIVVVVTAHAAGCGNDGRDASLERPDLTETGAPPTAGVPATTTAGLTTPAPNRARRLSSAERRRPRSIARSIEHAVVLFDRSVRACPDATWEGCVDRAWAALVGDLDWLAALLPPPLRRSYARLRVARFSSHRRERVQPWRAAGRLRRPRRICDTDPPPRLPRARTDFAPSLTSFAPPQPRAAADG